MFNSLQQYFYVNMFEASGFHSDGDLRSSLLVCSIM